MAPVPVVAGFVFISQVVTVQSSTNHHSGTHCSLIFDVNLGTHTVTQICTGISSHLLISKTHGYLHGMREARPCLRAKEPTTVIRST